MSRWLSQNRSKLEHAFRMTAASVAAYACAEALGLSQGFWAVITALIVTQNNVGGTLKAVLERFIGSLLGAIYGSAIVYFLPHSDGLTRAFVLIVAVAPLSFLAAFSAGFRVAPITAIIVLLGSATVTLGPVGFAEDRVLEVGLGCTIGLLISVLVVPARASWSILKTASEVTRLLADQLDTLADPDELAQDRLNALVERTRQTLRGLETQVGEAARERRSRLTDLPDPEPLLRAILRLRYDVSTIRRAVETSGQAAAEAQSSQDWKSVAESGATQLRALADALANRRSPERSDALARAVGAYRAAIDGMRRAAPARHLTADTLWWLMGTAFVLEQFHRDLDELVERIKEFSV